MSSPATAIDAPALALAELSSDVRDRLIVVASFIFFRLALDWSYVVAIVPVFEHEGYFLAPDLTSQLASWAMTLGLAMLAPTRSDRPSDTLVSVLLVAPVLPMLALVAWRGDSIWFAFICALAAALIMLLRRIEWPAMPVVPNGPQLALVLAGGVVFLTIAIMLARGGAQFATLDLAAVYLFRDTATERTLAGGTAYLADWSMKVLVPVLAALALRSGRTGLAILALTPELPIFALTAQKAPLAYLGLVVLIILLRTRRRPVPALVFALGGFVILSTTLFVAFEWVAPISLATRRVFFVPAHLNHAYFEYFRDAGHVQFATILPDWIVPYRFGFPTPQLVGDYLDPGSGLWANTGFLGTGYMHAGALGVLLYAAVLGALLGLADQFGRGEARWPVTIVLVIPFLLAFSSADLPTALLTHGIALSIGCAALLRKEQAA